MPSLPLLALPAILGGLAVLYALRWLAKTFVLHNPLDNIKGPASPSFLFGHLNLLLSNHPGLEFQQEISDTYGRVVLLKSEMGVRSL